MATSEPLIPGVTVSTWPEAKWVRAKSHLHEIEDQINAWLAQRPVMAAGHLADDSMSIEYKLDIRIPPPEQAVALVFGDFVHALRSALDGAVWAMVTQINPAPSKPKSIAFPVVTDQSKWPDVEKVLCDLPDEVLETIRSFQPFAISGSHAHIEILHDLDIRDKHRQSITVKPGPLSDLQVHLQQLVTTQPDTTLNLRDVVQEATFEDGEVMGRLSANKPIGLNGTIVATVSPLWIVEWGGFNVSLVDMCNELLGAVRIVLDALYGYVATLPPLQFVNKLPEPQGADS